MSAPVQRTYDVRYLVGSVPYPYPPITPARVFGAPLGGNGAPTFIPDNISVVWTYTDFLTGQIWSWSPAAVAWE